MNDKQKASFEYIKKISTQLESWDYNEICRVLGSFINSVPVPILETDKIFRFEETSPRDYSTIYRARENKEYPEYSGNRPPFQTLAEISIIPDEKKHRIEKYGRCNKPYFPVFYASNDVRTACMECLTSGFTKEVNESKMITVGSWKIKEPLILAPINYSIDSLNEFLPHDEARYSKMVKFCNEFSERQFHQFKIDKPQEFEFQMEVFKLFCKEFSRIDIKSHNDYKLGNFYCDQIFENTYLEDMKTQMDGILYPSVAFSYQEKNLALHPRAMKKLEFVNAMNFWVVYHAKDKTMQFIPLEQKVKADERGNLQWNKFLLKKM